MQQKILANRLEGLLVFVLLFSLGNLIQIPGWLFLAAAVLTLGREMGGIATYVAASISCVATFLIIRFVGGDALRQLDNRLATTGILFPNPQSRDAQSSGKRCGIVLSLGNLLCR